MDEQQLISALKQRDPMAFTQVFERYAPKIYRMAAQLLGDDQEADGVVQNAFLALIEKIDGFEGRASIGTWLYRVAYNEVLMRLRRARPQIDLDTFEEADIMPACLVDWEHLPESVLTNHEAAQMMAQAIAQLSPTLQTIFILRDVEGLSTSEVAQIMNISESAVKVRLHRARLALRERLAQYFEEYTLS